MIPNAEFIHTIADNNLPENSLDWAYSIFVTCTIPIQQQIIDVFTSIHTAIKPGAKFCLMNANREMFNGKRAKWFRLQKTDFLSDWTPVTALLQFKYGDMDESFLPVQDFFYSKNKYREMLEAAWFNSKKITIADLFQTSACTHETYDETVYSSIFVITAEK
jgi:hypothetical protein